MLDTPYRFLMDKKAGLYFVGHDAMHTFWNSDRAAATLFPTEAAAAAEAKRAGLKVEK